MRFLILGGTAEARQLAVALVADGVEVISSLAGRVSSPSLPAGRVRLGGFGGVDGLAGYLRKESVSAVVDASHPFAAKITQNAVQAASSPVRRWYGWSDLPGESIRARIRGRGWPMLQRRALQPNLRAGHSLLRDDSRCRTFRPGRIGR
jgi:hypothetical protein